MNLNKEETKEVLNWLRWGVKMFPSNVAKGECAAFLARLESKASYLNHVVISKVPLEEGAWVSLWVSGKRVLLRKYDDVKNARTLAQQLSEIMEIPMREE